jgi:hypothetical protein
MDKVNYGQDISLNKAKEENTNVPFKELKDISTYYDKNLKTIRRWLKSGKVKQLPD